MRNRKIKPVSCRGGSFLARLPIRSFIHSFVHPIVTLGKAVLGRDRSLPDRLEDVQQTVQLHVSISFSAALPVRRKTSLKLCNVPCILATPRIDTFVHHERNRKMVIYMYVCTCIYIFLIFALSVCLQHYEKLSIHLHQGWRTRRTGSNLVSTSMSLSILFSIMVIVIILRVLS